MVAAGPSQRNYGTISSTGIMNDHESARKQDKDAVVGRHDAFSDTSSDINQAGVKGVEAITLTWTVWSLVSAYVG